jgi:hypothetical protein
MGFAKRRFRVLGAPLLALLAASCRDAAVPELLPPGTWGGEHVGLVVSETEARIEFDCAHGLVDGRWPLDREGGFHVSGHFVREHGGPVREGEAEDVQPAEYTGRVDGHNLHLDVRLQDGTRVGPFGARLGRTPNVYKCL